MAMVPVLGVLDMLDSDMDILVLDMLDMVVMDLAMAVLATMARGLLMLSQRLMLVFTMEDMAMVLVWDMMDLDTVLDMDVPYTVKQLIYASKSSKVIFLLFSALLRVRNFLFHVRIK